MSMWSSSYSLCAMLSFLDMLFVKLKYSKLLQIEFSAPTFGAGDRGFEFPEEQLQPQSQSVPVPSPGIWRGLRQEGYLV